MCGIGKDLGRNGDGIRRKLICLGDSLTFGAGVTRRDCWTSLVQRECGWTVVNRGISGDTVSYTHLDVYKRQVLYQRYL